MYYDLDKNVLAFYTELYGTSFLGDSVPFLIDYSINDAQTDKVAFNIRGISKLKASEKHVILKTIDL